MTKLERIRAIVEERIRRHEGYDNPDKSFSVPFNHLLAFEEIRDILEEPEKGEGGKSFSARGCEGDYHLFSILDKQHHCRCGSFEVSYKGGSLSSPAKMCLCDKPAGHDNRCRVHEVECADSHDECSAGNHHHACPMWCRGGCSIHREKKGNTPPHG